MRETIIRLRQNWLARAFINYFAPRSSHPSEVFRERAIRVVALVAFVFFSVTLVPTIFIANYPRETVIQSLAWYVCIYGLIAVILVILRTGNVRLAGRCTVLAIVLMLFDTSKAYWSPGTAIFSLMFTFLFEMVLDNWRDIMIAIGLNLVVYTGIAASVVGPSPLRPDDYFSDPFSALLTVYTANFIIMGVAYYIRREQQARDRIELLAQQQHVEILRQFLGHTSHDLRTGLSKIRLSLYRFSRQPAADDHQALEALTRSVDDLEKLLLSMIEMSQLDDVSQFTMGVVDIQKMLTGLIDQLGPTVEQKHQALTFLSKSTPLIVQANEEYLTRAVSNVLDNAIKFTPENGALSINAAVDAEQVVITIADSGSGIEAAKLPFIYDRFYRGDEARTQSRGNTGMGLGLSITKKIIELHNGHIQIESIQGQGTTCTIKLPIYKAKHQSVGNRDRLIGPSTRPA